MGGAWDATNVADAQVAVITPIAVDHARLPRRHARRRSRVEKAGIIKPGATVVMADAADDVAAVLARAGRRGRRDRAPRGPGLRRGAPGAGGRRPDDAAAGARAEYDEVFLPLYGAHQAQNAVLALAAVEAFARRGDPLDADVVHEAFGEVTSPGRLEVIRRSPDDRAGRRAQPARGGGHRRRDARTRSCSAR